MHDVDLFNGNLYSPAKIEDINTRQTRSDDFLGLLNLRRIVIEIVENGIVRNCQFTDDDIYQVRTKKGKQHFSDYFFYWY